MAQKLLLRILIGLQKNEIHHFLCVRTTQPEIRQSVFQLFLDLIQDWGIRRICKINITHMLISFEGGSTIRCIGLDAENKLKSITHMTGGWVEEADGISAEDALQVNIRLRGPTDSYKQIIYSLNPVSKLGWIYPRFYKEEDPDVTTHHSTYKDNRFMDAEDAKILDGLIKQDKNKYKIYALGEWGSLGAVIYRNYEIIETMPTTGGEIIYGLDFGWQAPSALVEVRKVAGEYYLTEKLYERKKHIPQLIVYLKKINHMRRVVYCDSADPSKSAEMRMMNINALDAKKGKGSVERGIEFIKRNKFYVNYNSVNLIKELSGYVYKKNKDGTTSDAPIEYNDHLLDAFRYAVWSHWGGVGQRQYGFIY